MMSDCDGQCEKHIDSGDVNVLGVGHHGSKRSSSKEFISRTKPELAVISVGKNSYGFPSKECLDRLIDSEIFTTQKDGTVKIADTGSEVVSV